MTLFIYTAGTSLAGGPLRDGEAVTDYRKRIDNEIASDRAASGSREQFLIRVSAEMNALLRSRAVEGDQVVYLVSETEDGQLCGERLVELTRSELGSRARSVVIEGLQVKDGKRFRQLGVRNLFDEIDRLRKDTTEEKVELNATGGFKGMVPYLTLYGMFHDLPVSYIFEQSNTLIQLPRIPLAFDWGRLAPAAEAVFALSRDVLREQELHALLPADYWDPGAKADYECLFDREDGFVSLSAIGLLMKGRLDSAIEGTEVLLSPQAKGALDAAEQEVRSHYEFMLARVRNPLQRASSGHAERLNKTDLKAWKRYGQSGARMLYWVEELRVLVGELMKHDDYIAYVNGSPRRQSDYERERFTGYLNTQPVDWSAA
jgi:putative CRISPR-associated protein (TIGR02619 family)